MLADQVGDLLIVRHAVDLGDELLDQRLHRRRPALQLPGQLRHGGIERIGIHHPVDQADLQGRGGIEDPAVHQELARLARPHRLDQYRNGDAGQQAVACRGQAEAGLGRCHGKIAGQHQADAAAYGRALDPRNRRLGKIVDRLHRAHHGVGADLSGDGIEFGPGQHPVEIAAGREGRPLACDDQHAHGFVCSESRDRIDDDAGGIAVEGVHFLRPVEGERRYAPFDLGQDGRRHGLHHIRKTPNFV